MITNPGGAPLTQAIHLKSALQEVSARNSGFSGPVSSASGPVTLNLKNFDQSLGQIIPKGYLQSIQVGFIPQKDQLVALKVDHEHSIYGQVVIPTKAGDAPYIRPLSNDEAKALTGTRQDIKVIEMANQLTTTPKSTTSLIKIPVFFEPGERLILSVYHYILEFWNWPDTPLAYVVQLGLIFIIAVVAIMLMWLRALSAI